eukprot:TRINITY_DN9571_c0_g1_i1.p1 TRINITY_DN9571_c0_g1~~TRINITY_DN9571_c0_g1_i1.p1  ORF type:complete len:169 (-),score=11.36 TRINITY_DN9571_c0_g1_i1:59-541(-)
MDISDYHVVGYLRHWITAEKRAAALELMRPAAADADNTQPVLVEPAKHAKTPPRQTIALPPQAVVPIPPTGYVVSTRHKRGEPVNTPATKNEPVDVLSPLPPPMLPSSTRARRTRPTPTDDLVASAPKFNPFSSPVQPTFRTKQTLTHSGRWVYHNAISN